MLDQHRSATAAFTMDLGMMPLGLSDSMSKHFVLSGQLDTTASMPSSSYSLSSLMKTCVLNAS